MSFVVKREQRHGPRAFSMEGPWVVKVTTETAFQGWHHFGLGVQRKEMTPPQISGS